MGENGSGSAWQTYGFIAFIVLVAGGLLLALPYVAGFLFRTGDRSVWAGLIVLALGLVAFYLGFKAYKERQLVRDTPTSKARSLAIGTAEVQGRAQPLAEPLISPLTHTPACMFEFKIEEEQVVRRSRRTWTGRRKTKKEKEWRTVFSVKERIPFCIDDGTGRVPVEADDAEMDIQLEERVEVQGDEPPPAALGEWAEDHGPELGDIRLPGHLGEMVDAFQSGQLDPEEMEPGQFLPEDFDPESDDPSQLNPEDMKLGSILYGLEGDDGGAGPGPGPGARGSGGSGGLLDAAKTLASTGKEIAEAASQMSGRRYLTDTTPNKRRFREWVLGAGEGTYVFGSARRLPEADSIENVENLVLQDDPTTGMFLVSDKSPDRLLDDKLTGAALGIAAAVVLVPYGLVGLLIWAGLV